MKPLSPFASAGLALVLLGTAAPALELPPAATLAAEDSAALSSAQVPVGAFDGTDVPMVEAEGAVIHQAWQQPLNGMTTLQILEPLRAQLVSQGYEIVFECAAESCGGFDFRFSTETLPEPAMHVDLGDFRFLTARRQGDDRTDYACLMVSRSANRGFVQVSRIGPPAALPATPSTMTLVPEPVAPLIERLERDGRAVLADLDFATGSAALGDTGLEALQVLAKYLSANSDRSVVLVGHTDAEGALGSNIALSRKRAEAVRDYLIGTLGVPRTQVTAEGVGFLAPRATNETEAGRMRNRRVEVILSAAD